MTTTGMVAVMSASYVDMIISVYVNCLTRCFHKSLANMIVCVSMGLSVYLLVYLSVCTFIYLPTYMSACVYTVFFSYSFSAIIDRGVTTAAYLLPPLALMFHSVTYLLPSFFRKNNRWRFLSHLLRKTLKSNIIRLIPGCLPVRCPFSPCLYWF